MTHYTKQIYDYEDDFDYRVPSEATFYKLDLESLNTLFITRMQELGEYIMSNIPLESVLESNKVLLNSQSNFTQNKGCE